MTRVSKEKQDQTLNNMKERRYDDMVFLREIAKDKIKWADLEINKGLELIKTYEAEIVKLQKQVTRLEGYKLAMKEIAEKEVEKPNV